MEEESNRDGQPADAVGAGEAAPAPCSSGMH